MTEEKRPCFFPKKATAKKVAFGKGVASLPKKDITKEYIIQDAFFNKIIDLPLTSSSMKEFMENYILKSYNMGILLSNFSNIYVLTAHKGSESNLESDEISWRDILNEEQYSFYKNNNHYIIGFISLVNKKDREIEYIDFMDTRVRGYNLGEYMIKRYEKEFNNVLFPKEIIKSSIRYWSKYFEKLGYSINELDQLMKDYNLDKEKLEWEELYRLAE